MKPSNTRVDIAVPASPLSSVREMSSIMQDIEETLKVSHDLVDTMFGTFGHMLDSNIPADSKCAPECPTPVASPCGGRLVDSLDRLKALNKKLIDFTNRHDK